MSENPNFLDYIWLLISAPIGFMAQRYTSLTSRVTRNEAEIENLKTTDEAICKQLTDMNSKLDSIAKDLNQLIGRYDEHTKES